MRTVKPIWFTQIKCKLNESVSFKKAGNKETGQSFTVLVIFEEGYLDVRELPPQ